MRTFGVILLALSAGCAGIEGDIKRAKMKEFFTGVVRGRDRGSGYYAYRIQQSTTKPINGRYQYKVPAHLSHFSVDLSVRGLGGTSVDDSDDLARVADWLLFTLAYDPTAAVRSLACEQVGRVLLRLPIKTTVVKADAGADQRINVLAQDLFKLSAELSEGKRVAESRVTDRMRALAKESPPTKQAAQQMVRALAIKPVLGAPADSDVRRTAEEILPRIVRDAILVVLREVCCGDPLRPQFSADESPLVRAAAARVLARVASPIAIAEVKWAIDDPFDPRERDPDVRSQMVAYLGAVGGLPQWGPAAFDICLRRLDDRILSVRFHAQEALQRMTGAVVEPRIEAWEKWREARSAWRLPTKKKGA